MTANSPQKKRPRVALATCTLQPGLYEEEAEILPALRTLGVEAEAVCWDAVGLDWSAFDAVAIRSTWDYFQRYPEFCAWLDRIAPLTRLINSAPLVRWNLDKSYLRDLRARGVRIVPTVFCEKGEIADLAGILAAEGWNDAVFKPYVSGGAYRTHRISSENARAQQDEMNALLETTGVLVQPFFPEIQIEGEWSFVFFDGALSHTVIKRPVANEYRIQPMFGGVSTAQTPEPSLVAQAQAVLDALPEKPAYARIDGVRREGALYLMEAELVEPYLYMAAAPGSLGRYAKTIAKLVGAG